MLIAESRCWNLLYHSVNSSVCLKIFNNKVLDKKRQWQCSVISLLNETSKRAPARTVPWVGSTGTRE